MRRLALERAGDGPPLVLLHGLLGSGRNLASLARGLRERVPARSVLTLDLTGHGASPALPAGADAATLAGDVLATVEALALPGPMALVGHSLGGRVALHCARQAPRSVAAVALLDVPPGALPTGGEVGRVLDILLGVPDVFASRGAARAQLVAAGLAVPVADWLLLNLVPDGDGVRWRVDRRALAALHGRVVAEDLWPVIAAPRPWALACVRAGASGYVSDDDLRRLRGAGARVTTVEGAGHLLHVEQPVAVRDAVLAVLDQGPGRQEHARTTS